MNFQNKQTTSRKTRGKIIFDSQLEENPGIQPGYYLVVERTQERHWFAGSFYDAVCKLNAACEKHLKNGDYRYWVDYSYGVDVVGAAAWDNLDHTDALLDAGA